MSLNRQAELDGIYSRMAADYGKLNDAQVAFAIKEVGRVRGDIAELLSEFADDNGTVKRQRLSRLLRELDGVEKALRENGTVALNKSIKESTDFAINGMNDGAMSVIGKPLISGGVERLNKQTVDYVIRRFGDDGLVLSDRIWGTSGEIRDSISSVIRSGIIRGDNVGSMVRDIRKAYDAETWKIKRLVVTEGNTAYRVASANSVRQSEVADYVKINENGSRHGNHTNHRCYKLAKIDKYGEGNGIYKPTDTEIYMPHPQCSSYISAVILDKYLTGDFGGTEPNAEPAAESIAEAYTEAAVKAQGGKVAKGNNALTKLYGGKDDEDIEMALAKSINTALKGKHKNAGSAVHELRMEWVDDSTSDYSTALENYFSDKFGLSYKIDTDVKLSKAEKAGLDVMQAQTVARFKEAGITHVKVYRGVAWGDKNSWLPDNVKDMKLTGRGMSSWTTRKDVALDYASYVDDFAEMGNMAGVIEAVIPVDQIGFTAIIGDTDEIVAIGDIIGAKLIKSRKRGGKW